MGGLGIAVLAAILIVRRAGPGNAASYRAVDTACGCADASHAPDPAGAPPKAISELRPAAAIACTLTPGDFRERVNWIRNLARESLRNVRRVPLALHLTYAADAAGRVREMVREEEACCAFLRFDLREDAGGIHLTVAAPEEARDAANELFAHFAPEWRLSPAASSPGEQEQVQP